MKRRVFLAALAFGVAWVAEGATLVKYPYLQNCRGDRVTLRWTTLEPGAGVVEYSTDKSTWRSVTARMQEFLPSETGLGYVYYRHQAVLTGLATGTDYYYRVLVDGEDLLGEDELRFRTRGFNPFSFLVFGDSGMGTPQQALLAERMTLERPRLVLHTGDIAYPYGSFEYYQTRYFDYYRALMERVPFFPSPGNHDYQWDRAKSYRTVHAVPTEDVIEADQGRYYSFDWGNVHFISLDSNDALVAAANGNGAMLRWLDEDLRKTRQYWRVVYFHHPPYASGPNQADPLSALARSHVVPILERYHVPLVLNGHEHSYQRSYPIRSGQVVEGGPGAVYVTTGGGGARLYPVFPSALIAAGESVYHYVRSEVNGDQMTLRAIRMDGEEFDHVTLRPAPAIAERGAVNGADFTASLAPGGLLTIKGWQLVAEERSAARLPLPTELANTSVKLNGRPLPLLYVSPSQINAQLPFDVEGSAVLEITTGNGATTANVVIAEAAPAIFTVGLESERRPAITHADGTLVSDQAPAGPGEKLSVYLTGLGRVLGAIAAGQSVPLAPLFPTGAAVVVYIGERPLPALFAGLTPGSVGLYQVDFEVPLSLGDGSYPVRISTRGAASQEVSLPVRAAQPE